MVFIPPWAIVHSRIYKAQLPYFSERFRCITWDGRGNGKSDRPAEAAAYSLDNYVADALAVMDATSAGQAIVVGLSFGGMIASVLAAHHPERVKAAILVGTVSSIGRPTIPIWPTSISMPNKSASTAGTSSTGRIGCELSRLRRTLHPQHPVRSALDQADRGRHRLGGAKRQVMCWSRPSKHG
jgi:pimeloyl-ACP methyl ester carboxylesterase